MNPLISVSSRASSDARDGHYYWMYKQLFYHQLSEGEGDGKTIAPRSQRADHLISILEGSLARRQFLLGPSSLSKFPLAPLVREIRKLARTNPPSIQFYDGGLLELLVAFQLARKFPDSQILFNFHWAIQWVEIFASPRAIPKLLSRAVTKSLSQAGKNLRLSAESQKLAGFIEEQLGVSCEVYPIFSGLKTDKRQPWRDRDIDVLLMPQRASEIPLVLDLALKLRSVPVSVGVAVREDVWEKGVMNARPEARKVLLGDFLQIVFTPLSLDSYRNLLLSSKLTVLPYDKPYFEWGSSGKFNEAISLGSFPFVPATTAIASQSVLDETEHVFDPLQINDAIDIFESRLQQGFPQGLTGITIEDFFFWFKQFKIATPQFRNTRGQSRLFKLQLLAFLYTATNLGKMPFWRSPLLKKVDLSVTRTLAHVRRSFGRR